MPPRNLGAGGNEIDRIGRVGLRRTFTAYRSGCPGFTLHGRILVEVKVGHKAASAGKAIVASHCMKSLCGKRRCSTC